MTSATPLMVLFDLDGTLVDSGPGIMKSLAFALSAHGISPLGRQDLEKCVGPPLREALVNIARLDQDEVEAAVATYREHYSAYGLDGSVVYPGIPNLLDRLREGGAILAVATSKPQVYAERQLWECGSREYFSAVVGSELDGSRSRKSELIAEALEIADGSFRSAVMVGDRAQDVIGARHHGIPCIGVLWGYGTREELVGAGVSALAATSDDLLACLRAIGIGRREP